MALALSLFILVLQFCLVIFMLYLCIAFLTGAPFVPTTKKASNAMIDLARIQKGDIVYDLGSGDGRLLFLAAQKGAIARGIEINPFLALYTNLRAILTGYRGRVWTTWGSFWSANLKDADVVLIYLLPWRMEKLEKKLTHELKPQTLIVSNSFIFPHIKMCRQDAANHVYAFRIPRNPPN